MGQDAPERGKNAQRQTPPRAISRPMTGPPPSSRTKACSRRSLLPATAARHQENPAHPIASSSGYFALLKPRVMSLVMFTALTGVLIAPSHVNPVMGFASLLAIAAGAGAAGGPHKWGGARIVCGAGGP